MTATVSILRAVPKPGKSRAAQERNLRRLHTADAQRVQRLKLTQAQHVGYDEQSERINSALFAATTQYVTTARQLAAVLQPGCAFRESLLATVALHDGTGATR